MVITETELLEPKLLDRVWWRWMEEVLPTKSTLVQTIIQEKITFKYSYTDENRSAKIPQDFEHWLYDQGAEVRQIKGKRYLQFVDAAAATMFAIKHL